MHNITKRLVSLVLALFGCSAAVHAATNCPTPTQPATYCVGPAATGTGCGNDWNNLKAWSDAPQRGDTWYLKDGKYPGRTFSTQNNLASTISIKKAIGALGQPGHGTDAGWVEATMGTGSAEITSTLYVSSSYWIFDGQKGKGFSVQPPDNDSAHYGIYMSSGWACVELGLNVGNITLSHIYAPANKSDPNAAGGGWFIHESNERVPGNINDITISYSLFDGWGQAIRAGEYYLHPWNTVLWEYNVFHNMYTSQVYNLHGNPINAMWADITNLTVRNSLFHNTYGDGGLSQVISGNGAGIRNAKIYGNVFDKCWAGPAIIAGNASNASQGIFDSVIYHNTFLLSESGRPNDGGGLAGDTVSSGNTFQNNLAYSCRAEVRGGMSGDYNQYLSTWQHPTNEPHSEVILNASDPFVDSAHQNYSLRANTIPGNTKLPSEFNSDPLQKPRTTWTRGAFEFDGPRPAAPSNVKVMP